MIDSVRWLSKFDFEPLMYQGEAAKGISEGEPEGAHFLEWMWVDGLKVMPAEELLGGLKREEGHSLLWDIWDNAGQPQRVVSIRRFHFNYNIYLAS